MKNKLTITFATIVLAVMIVGITQAKSELEEASFDVKPGGTLFVDSDSGAIQVESHNRDTVDIEVETQGRNADDFIVKFSQDGNDIKVIGERKNRFGFNHLKAKFIVKIPSNYNVDLKTGGGSIELSDLKGKVDARTSGGSISLGEIEGDVEVKTSGGSIRVEEVAGNINAHTAGGSIRATLSKQPTEDCRLTTSGGSINVSLAPGIAIDLDARTSGGRVRSDLNVNGKHKRQRITGTVNGGGPDLYLKTSGGSVNIQSI